MFVHMNCGLNDIVISHLFDIFRILWKINGLYYCFGVVVH